MTKRINKKEKNFFSKRNPHFLCVPKFIDLYAIMSIEITSYNFKKYVDHRRFLNKYLRDSLYFPFDYSIQHKENAKFCFFYGKWFYRKDHKKTFHDFVSNFQNCDFVIAEKANKIKKHPFRLVKFVLLMFVWIIQLLLFGHSLRESLVYLPFLMTCVEIKHIVTKIKKYQYKFIVTYYDVAPDQNCFTQFFKKYSIPTMTLQHGMFEKKKNPKSVFDVGIEYTSCISDYYLAWNQYTKDKAVEAGMNEDKVVVLGIPKYSTKSKPSLKSSEKKNLFGVMLNSPGFNQNNLKVLETANEIYERTGIHFVLRYHPDLPHNCFESQCGEGYAGILSNTESIEEYTRHVDFTIISNSSVLIDLLFLQHPTFRLIISNDDAYASITNNSFCNIDDFVLIYKNNDGTVDPTIFSYLCTGYNTIERYKQFFDEMEQR